MRYRHQKRRRPRNAMPGSRQGVRLPVAVLAVALVAVITTLTVVTSAWTSDGRTGTPPSGDVTWADSGQTASVRYESVSPLQEETAFQKQVKSGAYEAALRQQMGLDEETEGTEEEVTPGDTAVDGAPQTGAASKSVPEARSLQLTTHTTGTLTAGGGLFQLFQGGMDGLSSTEEVSVQEETQKPVAQDESDENADDSVVMAEEYTEPEGESAGEAESPAATEPPESASSQVTEEETTPSIPGYTEVEGQEDENDGRHDFIGGGGGGGTTDSGNSGGATAGGSVANGQGAANSVAGASAKMDHTLYAAVYVAVAQVVDTAQEQGGGIGAGRIMLTDIKAAGFLPPKDELGNDMIFLGWELTTGNGLYPAGTRFMAGEYYSLKDTEIPTEIGFRVVWGRQVYVDTANGNDSWSGRSDVHTGAPEQYICTAQDGIHQVGDTLSPADFSLKSQSLDPTKWRGEEAGPVRTLGRAYEVLARSESGNPNGNLDGMKVANFDPETGTGHVLEADAVNQVEAYNGQIVFIGDYTYQDETEGRYAYLTWGELRNQIYSKTKEGKTYFAIDFDDGVSVKTAILGMSNGTDANAKTLFFQPNQMDYLDEEYVRFQYRGFAGYETYGIVTKTASCPGGAYYHLKKESNVFSYECGGKTVYTYGRLTQYSDGLRTHTGTGLTTPKHDGIVRITAQNAATVFTFGDYTRYALGGDTLFADLTLRFTHPGTKADTQSSAYVGGLMAAGHYLGIEDGVQVQKTNADPYTPYYYIPNIYGGDSSNRTQGDYIFGQLGNQLGDSGNNDADKVYLEDVTAQLYRSRLTIKSGTWAHAYGGSYGLTVGHEIEDAAHGGYGENNAAVLNIYGGEYSYICGAGQEGAKAYNTYVYVYKIGKSLNTGGVTGAGMTGTLKGNGTANVLIAMDASDLKINAVYGGSLSGVNEGNTNVVLKAGSVGSLYGGSAMGDLTGDATVSVTGGTVETLVGGGKSGSVTGKVTVNIAGGTVKGKIYACGQGDTEMDAQMKQSYYQGTTDNGTLTDQILDPTDDRLNLLLGGSKDTDNKAVQALSNEAAAQNLTELGFVNRYMNSTAYLGADGLPYYYPHVFNEAAGDVEQYAYVVTGYQHQVSMAHTGAGQHTLTRSYATLSLSEVGEVEFNITGGVLSGDVYGGGAVSMVKGPVRLNLSGGVFLGDVYGGGDGTIVPSVALSYEMEKFSGNAETATKTELFQWAGSDHFGNIDDYSTDGSGGKVPIDYANKKIYSPYYDQMGAVAGNITVQVSDKADIAGSVYGGGNEGNVYGNTNVILDGGTVTKHVFAGAKSANIMPEQEDSQVGGNAFLVINGGKVIGTVYGGNDKGGTVARDTSVQITGGTLGSTEGTATDAVFGGGNQAAHLGIARVTITGGVMGRVYGGGNQGAVGGTQVQVFGGEIYGALTGGSRSANVGFDVGHGDTNTKNTEVTLFGGTVYGAIYGGCHTAGEVKGNAYVVLAAPTPTTVFGGGYGAQTSVLGDTRVLLSANLPAGTPLNEAGGEIPFGLYGGALSGTVGGDAKVYAIGTEYEKNLRSGQHLQTVFDEIEGRIGRLTEEDFYDTEITANGIVTGSGYGESNAVAGKSEVVLKHAKAQDP